MCHIAPDDIRLQIEQHARRSLTQVGMFTRIGDQREAEAILLSVDHGQAHSIKGDETFGHHIESQVARQLHFAVAFDAVVSGGEYAYGCFDMALDHMPADALVSRERTFEVDMCS